MKLKVFDVIELKTGAKATILEKNNNGYKVEVVDRNGFRQEVKNIVESEIKKVILLK